MTAPRPATLAVLGSLLALLAATASRRTLDAAPADDGQWVRPAKDLAALSYTRPEPTAMSSLKPFSSLLCSHSWISRKPGLVEFNDR